MKKTVMYIRQSLDTDKQKNSLEMQRSHCLEYAKQRDWIVDEVYNEGKCSARKTDMKERLQLTRLLNDCKKGTIGRILIFKRDRLARNVEQYLDILNQIRLCKVELHFAADNEPPLFGGVASDLIESLLAGIAEYEGNNIVRRLINSKKTAAGEGRWAAGSYPYAYIKKNEDQPGVLKIDSSKERIVKALYALAKIELCTKKVVDFKAFYETVQKKKLLKQLDEKQVWKILTQPLHKGVMSQTIDGEEYNRAAPDLLIVTVDSWEEVNDALSLMKPPSGVEKKSEEDEVIVPKLVGIAHCASCGEPFVATPKMYKCKTKGCKNSPHIERVDQDVLFTVRNRLLEKGMKEWETVRDQLQKLLVEPFEKKAHSLKHQIECLEQKIMENVKQHVKTSGVIDLNVSFVENYRENIIELDFVESRCFSIKSFVQLLTKEKELDRVKKEGLKPMEINSLLQLVKRVDYAKGIKEVSFICNERKGCLL
ncbi:recombinase family protein [Gottfriedia sp. NPDC056225]|uniref:recombinase family protein n=1 Tax=Gottfriedia sp. NPDC056225 TaxID=3345751 RepID=UPI0035DB065C